MTESGDNVCMYGWTDENFGRKDLLELQIIKDTTEMTWSERIVDGGC